MGTWLVTGGNRGIGLELCRQLQARGDDVIATCRTTSLELDAVGCRVIEGIDVGDDTVGERLIEALGDASLDVVVHNAGVLLLDGLDPPDLDAMRVQLEVNTLGPVRVTAALLPRLERGAKLAFVSSRAGSIGDRPSGGMYGYRMSKAALNMAAMSMTRDLAPKGILVSVLHPGFIRTQMTGGHGNDDPPVAAKGLLARIDELTPERSGRFFHANGEELPW